MSGLVVYVELSNSKLFMLQMCQDSMMQGSRAQKASQELLPQGGYTARLHTGCLTQCKLMEETLRGLTSQAGQASPPHALYSSDHSSDGLAPQWNSPPPFAAHTVPPPNPSPCVTTGAGFSSSTITWELRWNVSITRTDGPQSGFFQSRAHE